jgi:hypothetical protein
MSSRNLKRNDESLERRKKAKESRRPAADAATDSNDSSAHAANRISWDQQLSSAKVFRITKPGLAIPAGVRNVRNVTEICGISETAKFPDFWHPLTELVTCWHGEVTWLSSMRMASLVCWPIAVLGQIIGVRERVSLWGF